jgi:hypothetical protein
MKRIILFLTCCLAVLNTTIYAQTIVHSGTAGALTWTLDSNGTLTISGNGGIPGYSFSSRSNLKAVVITNGVKTIGNTDGYAATGLKKVAGLLYSERD